MPVKYQNVWNTMNSLEEVTSKICSAREILDCAIDAHQEHKHEKVEHLLYAVDEYLQYYLKEFDNKFKDAWKATVGDLRDGDTTSTLKCDKYYPSPESQGAWNDFWEQSYLSGVTDTPEEAEELREELKKVREEGGYDWTPKQDKVVKWQLPVEADASGEYFVQFPDDLLDAANLKEGDTVEWVDNGNGSYLLRKV